VDTADYLVFDHAGHFVGLASLDPQTWLVVSIRLIGSGVGEMIMHARRAVIPS
jgi:hypothetical protein